MYQIMAHRGSELRVLGTADYKEVAASKAEDFRQTEKGYIIWVVKKSEEQPKMRSEIQAGRGK